MAKNYLVHFGIMGQKWGIRRYQNEDGTYTSAGKKRRNAREINEVKVGNMWTALSARDPKIRELNYKMYQLDRLRRKSKDSSERHKLQKQYASTEKSMWKRDYENRIEAIRRVHGEEIAKAYAESHPFSYNPDAPYEVYGKF